jgi:lysophospholipase L1-like esterase
MKKYILTLLLGNFVFFLSCNNDFSEDMDTVFSSGEADFSKYIALGDAFTSGFRDNALYISGQKESFPLMIAEQMKRSGCRDFKIPFMADELGGIPDAKVDNKKILVVADGSLAPITSPGTGATTLSNIYSKEAYQNMGVPGAKSFHLLTTGYGNSANLASKKANPYFVRFASTPNSTVLEDAMSQSPTFFTLWIGVNDILSYATSGGDGSTLITDISTFKNAYTKLIQTLTSNSAKGVVANIPDVTDFPYFNKVTSLPFQANQFTSQQIKDLNASYKDYNLGLDQAKAKKLITEDEAAIRKIVFTEGKANGAVIIDKELTDLDKMGLPSIRMSTIKDLFLLSVSSILKTGGGTSKPIEDQYVLTDKEIGNIKEATQAFNTVIENLAKQYNLAFTDIKSLIKNLKTRDGILYNGVSYTNIFITGGFFSLDGVHPTGRGYAFIANEFIESINLKFKSNLPSVNPNLYQAVKFPER